MYFGGNALPPKGAPPLSLLINNLATSTGAQSAWNSLSSSSNFVLKIIPNGGLRIHRSKSAISRPFLPQVRTVNGLQLKKMPARDIYLFRIQFLCNNVNILFPTAKYFVFA